MKLLKQLLAFNRGVVSKIGLARIDIERMAMSCEQMTNWIPRILGSMMLRPGNRFLARINNDTTPGTSGRILPFMFSADDSVLLEFSPTIMQIRLVSDGDIYLERTAVTTQLTNVNFATTTPQVGSGWQDSSDTGGQVTHSTGNGEVSGDGTDFGKMYQEVTVTGGDQNVEHFLLIRITNGPVRFKVGTTNGDDDLFGETRLDRGNHHLSFTPTGATFYVEFANERQFKAQVSYCGMQTAAGKISVGIAGTVGEQPNGWATQEEMDSFRWAQSGDVIYLAQGGAKPSLKIERRGDGRSWSVVQYLPEDGPFKIQNVSGVTMAASALNGDITLTSSENVFSQAHADNRALFRIASNGQTVTKQISSEDDWTTPPIRVTGSENARQFQVIIEGTFTATVRLQFAFSEDGPWNDQGQTWTGPVSTTYNDGQDGSIIYYRIGVDTGDYTSGTVTATLVYANGSIEGIARVNSYTDPQTVGAQVLRPFGSTDGSRDWWEGAWSDDEGWPTAVELHEGRLWWAGNDKIWGSESDAYETFNDAAEGDAATIDKQIGFGPIRVIHWLLGLGRLMIGTSDNSANVAPAKMDGNHPLGARSSNFDEPLTPFNFNIKTVSSRGVFVDRTEQRLYELLYDVDNQDYRSVDLTVFAPDYNQAGIKRIAVQMKPDVRIHCVRNDGTVGLLVYDRLENVICWSEISMDGASGKVHDVAVLPGTVEDQVYYLVEHTINSGTQHHIVKWALESEAQGAAMNYIADSFVEYSGSATTTPFTTELLHLRDETVVVWADGDYAGEFVVSAAGGLTLTTAASSVVAGLGYMARFKSAKLGEMDGITLLERKKVNRLGFIAKWLHYQGLRYGPDFTNMQELPQVEDGKAVAAGTVWEDYHEDNFAFGGDWDTDSRICLEANAPKPATLLAAIAEMESVEKAGRRR